MHEYTMNAKQICLSDLEEWYQDIACWDPLVFGSRIFWRSQIFGKIRDFWFNVGSFWDDLPCKSVISGPRYPKIRAVGGKSAAGEENLTFGGPQNADLQKRFQNLVKISEPGNPPLLFTRF